MLEPRGHQNQLVRSDIGRNGQLARKCQSDPFGHFMVWAQCCKIICKVTLQITLHFVIMWVKAYFFLQFILYKKSVLRTILLYCHFQNKTSNNQLVGTH